MRGRLRIPIFLVVGLCASACAGNGNESPTAVNSATRLTVVLRTASSQTIQRATLVFDGRDVVTVDSARGAGQVTLEGVVNGVGHGSHSVRVVIVQQTSTPNAYSASGAVATEQLIQDLAPVQGVLATGESLEFRISL